VKIINLIFYSFNFCIYSIAFSMETVNLIKQPINHNNINTIELINDKINKKYPPNNALSDFFTRLQLTQEDKLTIITIPNAQKINIPLTASLLDGLYKKNNFFAEAVDYFTKFAHTNVGNVTCDTIDIVNNPESNQLIPELNLLPLPIKQYIMHRVYTEVLDEDALDYEITLPLSNVILFEICPSTDVIATFSKDKKLNLWDLTTGLYINSLQENNSVNLIRFNTDGSLIGTVFHYTTAQSSRPKSRIKIWGPQLQDLLHTINQDNFVYHIDFTQGTADTVLTIFSQEHHDQQHKTLTLWLLEKEKHKLLGHTSPFPWRGDQLSGIKNEKYNSFTHPNNNSKICIIKKNCSALYLCKQAIENNNNVDVLQNIPLSTTYSQLTEYEQNIVTKKINKKSAPSKIFNPMILMLQTK
jgi:WD40 repeat protein